MNRKDIKEIEIWLKEFTGKEHIVDFNQIRKILIDFKTINNIKSEH